MKKTAIIILNYNNPSDTIACIRSVEHYNTAPVKYIIIDNGSTDGESVAEIDRFLTDIFSENYRCVDEGDAVDSRLSDVTFLVSKTNDGYAKGNNKGILLAEGDDEIDRILIMNNDILFIEDIIPSLSSLQDQLPDCAIISPLLLTRDSKGIDWNCARKDTKVSVWIKNNFLAPFHWLMRKNYNVINRKSFLLYDLEKPYPDYMPIELPSGSCMLIKKEKFKEIGYFDPETFLYYEENILYRRCLRHGYRNYIATRLRCIHLGASTMVKSPSLFISRTALVSRNYYVSHYLDVPAYMRMLLKLSDAWLDMFMSLKNILRSRTKEGR